MGNKLDLTGQRFGYLTAIEPVYDNGKRKWLCKCDCGNTKLVEATTLRSGHNTSCGLNCLCKTGKGHKNFRGNNFVERDGYLVGTDRRGYEFYIDKEDFDLISSYCWTASASEQRMAAGGYYFCARMSRKAEGGHKMKMLQNFIWEHYNGSIPNGFIVDHKNMKPCDCRKSNLRLADRSLNGFNSVRERSSNTSVVGVSYIGEHCKYHAGKYRAYISCNGKRKELGIFIRREDAIIKRLKAELEMFGEICPSNIVYYKEYEDRINDK